MRLTPTRAAKRLREKHVWEVAFRLPCWLTGANFSGESAQVAAREYDKAARIAKRDRLNFPKGRELPAKNGKTLPTNENESSHETEL